MEPQGRNPLNLARWAQQSVEKKSRGLGLGAAARVAFDPKITAERYQQLKKAFDEIDADSSGKISLEEILNFLKRISDDTEEEYVRQIFESMDRNQDGEVSIDEFIGGFLEQVNGLTEAIAKLKQQNSEKRKELVELEKELQEVASTERINQWGVMEGSTLTVRVVEAQNLSSVGGKPSTYVTLLCERQKISTNVVPSNRNPEFDETFSFKINVGTGELLVQVYNQGRLSKDDLLGSCSVPLEEFKDQVRHERWFSLSGRSGNSRILLSVQWVHKRSEMLESTIKTLKEEVETDDAEVGRMEAELRKLGTDPLGMFTKETWVDRVEGKIIAEVQDFTESALSSVSNWGLLQTLAVLIVTFLAALTCFSRPDYASLTWSMVALMNELKGWKVNNYRYVIAGLVVTIIYDFFFVITDIEYLVFEIHEEAYINVERFSFTMAFFNFITKVLAFPIVVNNYVTARNRPQQVLEQS